ncbi:MAG: hypothetical protein IPM39_29560 [Chloroflexi bacterium]|nr:hypothetical protein [Chloroflexota bacterium]
MSILRISNGTTTVDLYDTAGLHLKRHGWNPLLAVENEFGDYNDVTDAISLNWAATTDNVRDATLQNLVRLGHQARAYERDRRITNPVWLEARTPTETNSRYALLRSIDIPQLDSWHWGPARGVNLALTITREGAWRAQSPSVTPLNITSMVSGTIYNHAYGLTSNYLDVLGSSALGDAYALPVFQVSHTNRQDFCTIALRSRLTQAELGGFRPHFHAVNFGDATYLVADAGATGGQKWERAVSGTGSMTNHVALPVGLSYYTGSYLVFAVAKATAALTSLQIGHSIQTTFAENANQPVTVPVTTSFMPLYLGRITMPPSGSVPGLSDPAAYYLNLQLAWSGSATFSLRNIYIVPVDEGVFTITDPTADFVADSVLERTWNRSSGNAYLDIAPIVRGRYLRLRAGWVTRVMFFYHNTDAKGGVGPTETAAVNVRALLRYLGIRGNT